MSDNDLRGLFVSVLDQAPPPLPSREEMVAAGRRDRIRRRGWWAVGVGAAAVVAIAAGTVVVPATGGSRAAGAPGVAKSPSRRPVSHVPAAQWQRAGQLLAALAARVPAGYTTPPASTRGPSSPFTSVDGWQATGWLYTAAIEVDRDGRAGTVRVFSFTDYGPAGTDDACAAAYQAGGSYDGCTVLAAADGTPVGVSWRGNGTGRDLQAVWVHDDRAVVVEELPYGLGGSGRPALTTPPFTEQEVADLS